MSKTKATNSTKPLVLSSYQCCFVPKCTSTTSRTPLKVFIQVPKNLKEREKWCRAVGYPEKQIHISSWICEDHFDLSNDMTNYQYWKLMGGAKVIRKGVLPRFFECQNKDPDDQTMVDPLRIESDSPIIVNCYKLDDDSNEFIIPDDFEKTKRRISDDEYETTNTQTKNISTSRKEICYIQPSQHVGTITVAPFAGNVGNFSSSRNDESRETMKNIPMNIGEYEDDAEIILDPCNGEISRGCSLDERTKIVNEKEKTAVLKETIYENTTKLLIEKDPLTFIGVCKNDLLMIDELSEKSGLSKKNIYLVLQKLRLNLTNAALSWYFGLPESTILPTIRRVLPIMAKYLCQWIRWPMINEIRFNIPLKSVKRFGRIQSIIDIFYIPIDKPKLPITKFNDRLHMRKYLISITPDGIINYLSSGYGSTATELQIIENSEYLNVLPNGASVLADRSYKKIEFIMEKKKCRLLKPPIVLIDLKNTEGEKSTIHVNNVKDYVEKIIERLADFRFFDTHCCSRDNMLENIDQAFIVAAALVNFQTMNLNEP